MNKFTRTRKVVSFTWKEWSQTKVWWRFENVLTCKSLYFI